MQVLLNYLKYSGVWFGVVVNPFHWQFGCISGERRDPVFENLISLGPVWIRVIIDDGRW